MGGPGSGYGRDSKRTTCGGLSLDVRHLHREGLLEPGQQLSWSGERNGKEPNYVHARIGADQIVLDHAVKRHSGTWQSVEYFIPVEWTACKLGGQRPWFRCPVPSCRRRVAILYGYSVFACRHCHQLVYASQREAMDARAARRLDRLRLRLGWNAGIFNAQGGKPKGMHWRTFLRLKAEHEALVNNVLAGMEKQLGFIERKLNKIEKLTMPKCLDSVS